MIMDSCVSSPECALFAAIRLVTISHLLKRGAELGDSARIRRRRRCPLWRIVDLLDRSALALARILPASSQMNLKAARVLDRLGRGGSASDFVGGCRSGRCMPARSLGIGKTFPAAGTNASQCSCSVNVCTQLAAALQVASQLIVPVIRLNAAIGLARLLLRGRPIRRESAAAESACPYPRY